MPGVGDLCRGRPAGEVGGLPGEERRALWAVVCRIGFLARGHSVARFACDGNPERTGRWSHIGSAEDRTAYPGSQAPSCPAAERPRLKPWASWKRRNETVDDRAAG